MNMQLARSLKIVAQTQDARPFLESPPSGPPNEVHWDLKLAYAEWGDPDRDWISVRVGRQLINYNNTILANSEWRNQGRSYDAVVANLHRGPYRLGLFAASAVVPLASGISHHQEGNNVYGAYGNVDRLLPKSAGKSMLEPFVLWRVQHALREDERAYGLRFKGVAAGSLDYSWEAILERGTYGTDRIDSWAQTFGAAYRFDRLRLHPRVFAQYDRASGDGKASDGVRGTFDTMYPTAHDRFGVADLFGWQNLVVERLGLTVEPRRRWTVTAQVLEIHLATAADGLYNSSGSVIVRDATGKSGTDVGREVDVYTWFELNRHLNFGAGIAHLAPGGFLKSTTTGPAYAYPYFAVNFKDDGKSR